MIDRPIQDYEYPEPPDEEDSFTRPCPKCGADVYEDSVRCPECGHYMETESTMVLSGRPWWFVVLAIAGIAAFVLFFAL